MGLFSPRWQLEHFLPRDPKIDEDANHEPIHGDVLAFDENVGKFVSATPPVQPGIGDVINDGDLIWWDATDAQLEPVTPTLPPDTAGTNDNDLLAWDTGTTEWIAAVPTLAIDEAGAADGEILEWDTVTSTWIANGNVFLAPAYGTISVAGGVAAQAVTSTAAKLTGFDTDGPSALTTVDNTDDSIVVTEAGTYLVQFSAAYSHAAATGVFFSVRVDGVGSAYQTSGVAADTVSAGGHLALTAGQTVTVYVSNNVGGDGNLTLIDAQLSVTRVGA